jgi:shikimate kinase
MKENGIVCFLHVEVEILVKRTFETQQKQQDNRPLFKTATSFEELHQLISQKWQERKEFYQKAHFEVKNNDLNEFLEKLKGNK